MPISIPEAGTTTVAAASRTLQTPIIVGPSASFGTENGQTAIAALVFPMNTRGMSSVRCQLLHYPVYAPSPPATPANVWLARSYLMFRLGGTASPYRPTHLGSFVNGITGAGSYVPLTVPTLLAVGVPVVLTISTAGFDAVWLEFDTSAGASGPQQDYDLVMATFSAVGS